MITPVNNYYSHESFQALKLNKKPNIKVQDTLKKVYTDIKKSKFVQKTNAGLDKFGKKLDKVDWEMVDIIGGLIVSSAMLAGIVAFVVKYIVPVVKFFKN